MVAMVNNKDPALSGVQPLGGVGGWVGWLRFITGCSGAINEVKKPV